jgi:hypothetical protein|tara:strand:- start:123 stop:512 length:390 start_codon:yes stop_codon:yes gene_type:complete
MMPKEQSDLVFVEVTKTLMMTRKQAQRLVRVARVLHSDIETISWDEEGNELRTLGDDFLTDDGQPDYALAAVQIPDPEALVGAEVVAMTHKNVEVDVIEKISRHWPNDWREDTIKRLNGDDDTSGGSTR